MQITQADQRPIVGVKLTHDAAVACVHGDKLIFSIELEKRYNRRRHHEARTVDEISAILFEQGLALGEVDVVLDGWKFGNTGRSLRQRVADYYDNSTPISKPEFVRFRSFGLVPSYKHAAGHLFGSLLTSPKIAIGIPSYHIVWDGGIAARLYSVIGLDVKFVADIGKLRGRFYSILATFVGLKSSDNKEGQLMSFIATGKLRADVVDVVRKLYSELLPIPVYAENNKPETAFLQLVFSACKGVESIDVALAIHTVVGEELVASAKANTPRGANITLSGGCALNIKWNSMLRNDAHFASVWVSPFPNDSGSAIGAAAAHAFVAYGVERLDWDVFCGPSLGYSDLQDGWIESECSVQQLAALLVSQPVVVLDGKAEAGPRALGNRSILANPANTKSKEILNKVKEREWWIPVAPVVKESRATEIFDPGTPDPHMLFEHKVRAEWKERIPAVVHLDGTARVQTVREPGMMHDLLDSFEAITGHPVLCNTSANFKGCGFFHNVASAQRWGKIPLIWSDGILFTKQQQN